MFKALRKLINQTKPKSASILSKATDKNISFAVWEYLFKSVKTASANAGLDSNIALKDFANKTTSTDHASNAGATNSILGNTDHLIHDALSHHISKYHAERQAENHSVADKHLSQAMKYMALGHKASGGDESKFFAPSAKPWEQTYAPGQAVNFARNIHSTNGGKMWPDHNYLENKPKDSHKALFKGHKDNSYPWHDVKVGDKYLSLDSKKEATGKSEDHPLDSHPIMSRVGSLVENHKDIKNANQRQSPLFYAGVNHVPTEAIDNYHRKSINWANDNLDYIGSNLDKHAEPGHGEKASERLHDVAKHQSNAARDILDGQSVKEEKPKKIDREQSESEMHANAAISGFSKIADRLPPELRKELESEIKSLHSNTDAYKKYISDK